jgi:5-methylcytosine-specific restriction endonuclease McrA
MTTEGIKKWRQKNIERGLCPYCGDPISPGLKLCEYHREQSKKAHSKRRNYLREHNICTSCGIRPSRQDLRTCQYCADRKKTPINKAKAKEYREKHKDQIRTYCAHNRNRQNAYIHETRYNGNWKKALERDNFQCQICGQTGNGKTIHVHHIDGNGDRYSEHPNHSLDNLITICSKCHSVLTYLLSHTQNKSVLLDLIARHK